MQIRIDTNIKEVQEALKKAAGQVPYAMMQALNKTALQAKSEIQTRLPSVFDRPTPWMINSVGPSRPEHFATKTRLTAEVAFKDDFGSGAARSMLEPHVFSGKRHHKAMEARLMAIGLLPSGYNIVPGAGAKLDAYGNMSRGQISQVLNVLGSYTESGFNKANLATRKRLAKGNAKKNTYGFVYWVNPVGAGQAKHIPPGVYQRIKTGYGSSLKPIMVFVKEAKYRKRFDFFGMVHRVINRDFNSNFNKAFDSAMKTALLKTQGKLL